MTLDTELRSLAEAIEAEQEPLTVGEVIARANAQAPASNRRWMLVAATLVVMISGFLALLALQLGGDEPSPLITAPPITLPTTVVDAESVNEATLDYQAGISWWMPSTVPEGWQYAYARQDGDLQTVTLEATVDGAERSAMQIVFGAPSASFDELAAMPGATTIEIGGLS